MLSLITKNLNGPMLLAIGHSSLLMGVGASSRCGRRPFGACVQFASQCSSPSLMPCSPGHPSSLRAGSATRPYSIHGIGSLAMEAIRSIFEMCMH